MTGPVERLTREALETRNRETLLEAFVAAARFALQDERYDDIRLPFAAAEQLGVDADAIVEQAAEHLDEDEAALLIAFAEGRP